MATEIGKIARMLSRAEPEKTPLKRQLDELTMLITSWPGGLALVVVIGLLARESFDDLFLIGISLAIAAIPTGLPAVVTRALARHAADGGEGDAIVKQLRSVETLGRRRRSAPTRPARSR